MMHTSCARLLFGIGAACVLGLAACAAPSPNPRPGTTPTVLITMLATATPSSTPLPPTPTAPPAPTPTPVPPKPITVALVGEPESLHPLYATSTAAQTVAAALFVGCIGQDETGAPVALGCERVPTQENGDVRFAGEGDDRHLEVTFRIRPGWRWTDGTPVTAQDAVYAWQLVMSPEGQLRDPITQKVFSMTPADERTIVVQFMSAAQARAAAAGALRGDVPFEYFSQLGDYADYKDQAGPVGDAFYWAVARWLPSHLLRDVPPSEQFAGVFSAKPVGDGAFELSAWNRGSDIALTRSSQPFPLESKGDAPGIVFKIVPDEGTAAQLVKDGGAQLSPPLPVEVVSRTFGTSSPGIALEQLTMPAFEQLVMNVSRPPFDDAKVRQAVRQALDVPAILLDPNAGPITAPFSLSPAGLFRGLPAEGFAAAYDPAQAKALLAEAGWLCGTTPCTKPVTQTDGTVVTQTSGVHPRNQRARPAQRAQPAHPETAGRRRFRRQYRDRARLGPQQQAVRAL